MTQRLVRAWMRSNDDRWIAHSVNSGEQFDIARTGRDTYDYYGGDTVRLHARTDGKWYGSMGTGGYYPNDATLNIRTSLDDDVRHDGAGFHDIPVQDNWPWVAICGLYAGPPLSYIEAGNRARFLGGQEIKDSFYTYDANNNATSTDAYSYRPAPSDDPGQDYAYFYITQLHATGPDATMVKNQASMLFDFAKAGQYYPPGYVWRKTRFELTFTAQVTYDQNVPAQFLDKLDQTRFEFVHKYPANLGTAAGETYSSLSSGTEHMLYSCGIPPGSSTLGNLVTRTRQHKQQLIVSPTSPNAYYTAFQARVKNYPVLDFDVPDSVNRLPVILPLIVAYTASIKVTALDAWYTYPDLPIDAPF